MDVTIFLDKKEMTDEVVFYKLKTGQNFF